MNGLTLVIPATRTETLDRCLAAVHAAEAPPEEIVVVQTPREAGPAAARNGGAARASHDVVMFLDADVLVHPDVFVRIRERFRRDPALTAVFGSYDDAPADPGVVSGFRNLLHHQVHQRAAGPASTFWSGLGAVRRDALLAAGGYDCARYERPSIEDVELGMRLCDSGAGIVLDPAIRGTHLKRWTLGSMIRTDLRARGVPWVGLLLRRRTSSSALNLGWRHRASAVASVGIVVAALLAQVIALAACLLVVVALNASFYALLARRRGPAQALAGVALHVVHHLTAVAALPLGIAIHLRERRAPRPEADPAATAPAAAR